MTVIEICAIVIAAAQIINTIFNATHWYLADKYRKDNLKAAAEHCAEHDKLRKDYDIRYDDIEQFVRSQVK